MNQLYHNTNLKCSKVITNSYSTSFSLGIKMLKKEQRPAIYAIYGFVRYADEIVDSFHGHDQETLLNEFEEETFIAIKRGISTNPVMHAFQWAVNKYKIDHHLIEAFLKSMRFDLTKKGHHQESYEEYIYGSAEVVGLMCLTIFCKNRKEYELLVPSARSLGAAFQKVNFLRDIKADFQDLGRTYFPNVDFENFTPEDKAQIEDDIKKDFDHAFEGIKKLPKEAKFGVYVAYIYYLMLFRKIKNTPHSEVAEKRIRIPDSKKAFLLFQCYFKYKLRLL